MHGLLISFVATAVGQPMSLVATDLEQFAAMYQALALAAEIAPTEAFAGTTGTCCCMVDSDGPYPYPCTVGEACTCPFYYGGEAGCKGSGISSVCEAAPAQESVAPMSTTSVGPVVAQQWSANVTYRDSVTNVTSVQPFYFDGQNQRYRNLIEGTSDLFHPGDKVIIDQLASNTTGLNFNLTLGTGDDSVCKPMQRPYADPFAVIAFATTRNGSSIVGGQPCDVWSGVLGSFNVSSCIGSDGVPREISFGTTSMTWSDIKVGPPPEEVFAPSKACATNYPTPACEETGTTNLDVYRIHSLAEPFSLEDRNIGDALGDMAFTCLSNGSGFGGASVVSWWKVEVSNAFGQYGYCLYDSVGHKNYCHGGTGIKVGRESALGQGVGHLQGQCSANLDVGNWYSLPAAGQCANGQPMGTDGCTWRNAQRVRTVNISCIMNERGLTRSCKEEFSHAPLSKSAAIFVAALASGDSAQGGCPDITPPTEVIV